MANIITDERLVEEVLIRGVEMVYPGKDDFKKVLLSGKRLKIYCGFDPSAPSLHIGNAILINKLSQFQKLGHEIIFLIGDFTGMIGDPTDKSAARKKLTREDVLENAKNFEKQASAYISFIGDNPALLKHNSEWSDKISFRDLIEITSHFTVQHMIQRDMFQARIKEEKPIFLHEFLYPVAQAYDCVALDVDVEIGGNDQMFNMLCGRDLIKSLKKKEKFVMTMKLLADDQGKKMGKSEGNVVFLDESAENMYGKVMSWPDGVLSAAFELCTNLPIEEVIEIYRQLKETDVNPRDLKMKLAYEITKMNHGEAGASTAQDYFIRTVQKKEQPTVVRSEKLDIGSMNILDLLVKIGLAPSRSDARRLVEQKGIKINGVVVDDLKKEIEILSEGTMVQKGKIHFVKVYN
jgi:tyrosyl-tRNA synthetase